MRAISISIWGLLAGAALSPIASSAASPYELSEGRYGDGLRRWSAETSIGVQYITGLSHSPDGQFYCYVIESADLASDLKRSKLFIVKTSDIESGLRASDTPSSRLVVNKTFRGSGRPAISNLRWSGDSKSITFLAQDRLGLLQRYEVRMGTFVVHQRTDWSTIVSTQFTEGETSIANESVLTIPAPPYPSTFLTRQEMQRLVYRESPLNKSAILKTKGNREFHINNYRVSPFSFLSISPDKRLAVALLEVGDVRQEWIRYSGLSELEDPDELAIAGITQFVLMDLKNGRYRPLIDAPSGMAATPAPSTSSHLFTSIARPSAFWSNDGKNVFLVNTALPLTIGKKQSSGSIISVNIDSMNATNLEQMVSANGRQIVSNVSWLADKSGLLISYKAVASSVTHARYIANASGWRRDPREFEVAKNSSAELPFKQISVVVRQSANLPPRVMATDGVKEIFLSEEDPALKDVWLAKQREIRWKLGSGQEMTAGLILPRQANGSLPLVVQAFYYKPDVFSPDGNLMHAHAAQSLAAKGFAVVNMPIPVTDSSNDLLQTPAELGDMRDRFDTMVEALAQKVPIDLNRIGIVGFSRGGFMVLHLITHPGRTKISAALIDDSFDGSYSTYVGLAAVSGNVWAKSTENTYGGNFWRHTDEWLKAETTFNIDKVRSPLLIGIHDAAAILYTKELIGSLSINRKPYDVVLYPDGGHDLTTPKQRLASYENTVDWMSFWLLNSESSRLPKSSQFQRWTTIRDRWEKQKAWEATGYEQGSRPQ